MEKNPQHRGLRPNPEWGQLPEGVRATKAMRFTLPSELADKLESMSKADRDNLIKEALQK